MKYSFTFSLFISFLFCFNSARSQSAWPKSIPIADGGKITVYEPQPESISGNTLTARSAVSVRKTQSEEPVFGAVFFTATLSNRSRMAELASFTVTNAKFSGVEDQSDVEKFSGLIEKNAPGWNLDRSVDDLEADVKRENDRSGNAFNNAAPKIIYVNKPASLVVLDGAPRILHDKNLDADKVVNSPNLIFKEGKQWNLYNGGTWYRSSEVTRGWQQNTNFSDKVKQINDEIKKQEKENNSGEAQNEVPTVTDIIVAIEPTELLQTDGEPDYKTLAGTSLLYISNSPNEIFKDINSQKTYILIAGRWYQSGNMNGPWEYVPSDKLPADFAKIPEGSDKDAVLANVGGTEQAEEAKIDGEIPQTAKVDRKTATVDVQYDGDPVFNFIEGTSLQLAENSNLTVMIDASGNYFALDNGVWFVSDDPYGPWMVANDRPRDIDDIPASSPAYNTKYVYIYDYTPDYVYTGYTSGYLGSYSYGPTIVYGTGYHYKPWFRRAYYPRPFTWGFGFMYDPWYGWNMNWGYHFGFFHAGFNYGRNYGYGGGWFGPSRYCPSYRQPYWGGGYYGRNSGRRDYYNDNRYYGRTPASSYENPSVVREESRGIAWRNNYNIYNNQRGVITRNVVRTRSLNRVAASNRQNLSVGRSIRSNNNINRSTDNNYRVTSPASTGNNKRLSRINNGRQPEVHNPNAGVSRDDNTLTERNTNENRGNIQNNTRPSNRDRQLNRQQQSGEHRVIRQNNTNRDEPAVTNPATSPRPSVTNRLNAREERPTITRPAEQRPEINNRPSAPVQRPEVNNRQSAPVQRPEFNNRQSSPPPQRPTITNSQPAQSGGSPRGNNAEQGRRPDRR